MSKKNRWKQNPSREEASISPAQLAANRANAQLSTGPRTQAGLACSSKNAVKHALTGQIVLLDTDDLAEYQLHVDAYFEDLEPRVRSKRIS